MNIFVKPGIGRDGKPLTVRDPQSGTILRETGEWKLQNEFWLHRVRDGDVVKSDPPPRDVRAGSSGNESAPPQVKTAKPKS